MNKKGWIRLLFFMIFVILSNFVILEYTNIGTIEDSKPRAHLVIKADETGVFQCYDNASANMQTFVYTDIGKESLFVVDVSVDDSKFGFSIGGQNDRILISEGFYDVLFYKQSVDLASWSEEINKNNISGISSAVSEQGLEISIDQDKYKGEVVWISKNLNDFRQRVEKGFDRDSLVLGLILCAILDLLIIKLLKKFDVYKGFAEDVFTERKLVATLAKNDFKSRFVGSYLGIIWAFVQPVVTVLVYWFVFQVGLKAGKQSDYPFILWLMAGLVPWFYFTEALNGGTNVLIEYNYLVKKVVFKISVLPIVKLISAMVVHLFFVVFLICMCWCYGYAPSIYSIQIIYYIVCTFVLVIGMVYFTAAVVVFFRDLAQIIQIVLQIGIWATPIMWNAPAMLAPKYVNILKINPMYYIVDGFRDSLLAKQWFFDKTMWTAYFWIVVIAMILIGVDIFNRLRMHFADVL